jgi:hypothetical protein
MQPERRSYSAKLRLEQRVALRRLPPPAIYGFGMRQPPVLY